MASRVLAFVIAVTAIACSGPPELPDPIAGAGAPGPRRGGTLRFAVTDDVRTLDPAIAYDEFSLYAEHLIFDTLVGFAPMSSGKPLELVGYLAERWTIAPDGKRYTFTLRPGIAYEDGTPIVADDFVFALERLLDPATKSPVPHFYAGIAKLSAPDARTVVIELGEPDASFLMLLALKFSAPQPRAHVAKVGADGMRARALASGPFRLAAWDEGRQLRFERNPRYWNPELPYLDAVVMDVSVDRDVGTLKFLAGEYDTLDRISSDKYIQFLHAAKWRPYVRSTAASTVYGEAMDCTRPPFDDRRVRQAMNYAIDKRKTLRIYNGRAVIAAGVLPPTIPGFDPERKPYPYDPEKARRLLAEAGYARGFEITYYQTKDEIAEKLAQSMQADLAAVGVKMNIRLLAFPTWYSALVRRQLQFSYTAWFMDFPDPWNFLEVKFHSRGIADENHESTNEAGYANPEVDRLLDEARRELDHERRMALYQRAEDLIVDDAPWIFHYHSSVNEVVQPYVKNYAYHPAYLRDYRETWLDRAGTK